MLSESPVQGLAHWGKGLGGDRCGFHVTAAPSELDSLFRAGSRRVLEMVCLGFHVWEPPAPIPVV